MPDDSSPDPEDEFRDMLREFLSGNSQIDPSRLAGAAGLPNDPAMIAELVRQLQNALQHSGDGINWGLAEEQAKALASRSSEPTAVAERDAVTQAFVVAALWLSEATSITELTTTPRLLSRTEWITATMPIWTQFAEPVATSIAD